MVSCFLTWFSVLLLLAYGYRRDSVTNGSGICWIYWSKRTCGSELIIAEFQWFYPLLLQLCYWLCQSVFVSMSSICFCGTAVMKVLWSNWMLLAEWLINVFFCFEGYSNLASWSCSCRTCIINSASYQNIPSR